MVYYINTRKEREREREKEKKECLSTFKMILYKGNRCRKKKKVDKDSVNPYFVESVRIYECILKMFVD